MLGEIKKLKDRLFPRFSTRYSKYNEDWRNFKKESLAAKRGFELKSSDKFPCLNDNSDVTYFDAHYIYHPAWAARIIKKINPSKHIDISSTLHFCSLISAFVPTEFYDYRPANLQLDNLFSGKADLTNLLFKDNSVDCISCMHTIEHIGLGRYGDALDPNGDIKAIEELKRVVKVGGSILFVTPIGKPKIMFNAHRIYSTDMIIDLFNGFDLKQFSLVRDDGTFKFEASTPEASDQNYGCGCFWFVKK